MVGIALCILITPKTIELGAFRFMQLGGLTAFPTFLIFTIGGVLRAAALISNGRWHGQWRFGAKLRAIGAGFGAIMWAQLAIALVLLTEVTGTISIGVPVYISLTAGELISCYRVAFVYDRNSEVVAGGNDARSSFS